MAELSMEARMLAEAREKALKDINSIRGEAMREGKREGIREGMKEGIQKGIKEGKREIAKKMLMEGLDLKLIIKITGLTESEVLELKSELKMNNKKVNLRRVSGGVFSIRLLVFLLTGKNRGG